MNVKSKCVKSELNEPKTPDSQNGPSEGSAIVGRQNITFIDAIELASLKPHPNHCRIHDDKQMVSLTRLIQKNGVIDPPILNERNEVMSGMARVQAAINAGLTDIPAIRANHLTADQQRAYMLSANKLIEKGTWNKKQLPLEIQYLSELVDFDVCDLGFEVAEADILIASLDLDSSLDVPPEPEPDKPAVTKPGDTWVFGEKHRLHCGDALDSVSYEALLQGMKADAAFVDMPYNVAIKGHAGNSGKIKHREFAMAAGEMTEDGFTVFLTKAHKRLLMHMVEGGLIFSCMDWRHLREILKAVRDAGLTLLNLCVWVKNNGGMGSLYRSQHELVLVLKNGTAKHRNNVELGKHGWYRTNVWNYDGVNSFNRERQADLKLHPTVKPVDLVADAIKDCTKRGDIVLDSFGGSGTTLIAAEKTGRCARLIEIDPLYCDVTIRRWQQLTGKDAVHAASGKTFNEIAGDTHG